MIFEVFIFNVLQLLWMIRTGLGWVTVPSGAATSLGALFTQIHHAAGLWDELCAEN
jgi:hypothetical protein